MGKLADVGDVVKAYEVKKNRWRNAKVVRVVNEVYTVFFVGKGKKEYTFGKLHIKPYTKKEVVVPVVPEVVDLTKEEDVQAPAHPSSEVIDIDADDSHMGCEDPYYIDRTGDPNVPAPIPRDPYANEPPTMEVHSYYDSARDERTGRSSGTNTYPFMDSTSRRNASKAPDVPVKKPEPEPVPEPKVLTLEERLALEKRMEKVMKNRHPGGYEEQQEEIEAEQERIRALRALRIQRRKDFRKKIQMSVPDNVKGRWKRIKDRQEKERQATMAKRKAAAELRRNRRRTRELSAAAYAETESDDDDLYDSSEEEDAVVPVHPPSRKRLSTTTDPSPPQKQSRLGVRACAQARRETPSPESVSGLDPVRPVDKAIQKARTAREEAARDLEVIEIPDSPVSDELSWIGASERPAEMQSRRWRIASCGLSLQQKQEQFAEQVRLSLEALKLKKSPAAADLEDVEIVEDDEATTATEEEENNSDELPILQERKKRYNFRNREAIKRNFVSPSFNKKLIEEERTRAEEEILRKCQGIDYWKIHNRVWLAQIRNVHGDKPKIGEEKHDEKIAVSSSSSRRKKGKPIRKRLGNSVVEALNRVDAHTVRKVEEYTREITRAHKDRTVAVPVTALSCTCCAVDTATNSGNGSANCNASGGDKNKNSKRFSVKAPWSTYKCSACAGGIHAWCAGRIITPLTAHIMCIACAEKGRGIFGIGTVKIPSLLCPLVEWACRTLPKKYRSGYRKWPVSQKTITDSISPRKKKEMESNLNKLREGINPKAALFDITQQIYENTYGRT